MKISFQSLTNARINCDIGFSLFQTWCNLTCYLYYTHSPQTNFLWSLAHGWREHLEIRATESNWWHMSNSSIRRLTACFICSFYNSLVWRVRFFNLQLLEPRSDRSIGENVYIRNGEDVSYISRGTITKSIIQLPVRRCRYI